MKYRLYRGSEISDFMRCRLRWKYKWVDKLVPKTPNGKLFFGNLFHKFAEVYYNSLTPESDMYEAQLSAWEAMVAMYRDTDTHRMQQIELDDLWDLANDVTEAYCNFWAEKDRNIRVIATELTFAIPLSNGIAYSGTIDKLWLDENDKLWFADYKSTSSIDKYVKRAPMDRQITRYFWALKQLSEGNGYVWSSNMKRWFPAEDWIEEFFSGNMPEPHGFIYDLVKRDVPNQPEPLKKGGLSKAKNQQTTYAVYLNAIYENKLTLEDPQTGLQHIPMEYDEILAHLKAQETEEGNAFFRRIPVFRNPNELEAAIQEFYAAAMESDRIRHIILEGYRESNPVTLLYEPVPFDPIYRNPTDDCSWDCGHKALCMAAMDGSEIYSLVDLFYDREEPTTDEYIEIGS